MTRSQRAGISLRVYSLESLEGFLEGFLGIFLFSFSVRWQEEESHSEKSLGEMTVAPFLPVYGAV